AGSPQPRPFSGDQAYCAATHFPFSFFSCQNECTMPATGSTISAWPSLAVAACTSAGQRGIVTSWLVPASGSHRPFVFGKPLTVTAGSPCFARNTPVDHSPPATPGE